jgi:hypothetical protein
MITSLENLMKRLLVLLAAMAFVVAAAQWGLAQATRNSSDPRRPLREPRRAPVPAEVAKGQDFSIILGQPTDKTVTVNVLSATAREVYVEYGETAGTYSGKTPSQNVVADVPVEIVLNGLKPNTRYFFRLHYRATEKAEFVATGDQSFHTQRSPGSTFTFELQGDSHPERAQMFDPNLYAQVLKAAAADKPDFYMLLGDDFSVDTLRTVTPKTVRDVYLYQRQFLNLVGAPIFLVNGNHEQASLANLDGTADSVAVLAQNARNSLFSQPAPNDFYTGDKKNVEHIGLLRDYYAFTWGDGLFVVIDPYWHSKIAVDNVLGKNEHAVKSLWDVTLGEEQYQWFKKTLQESKAKHKFVFAHHVLGTGRGGIEQATLFEWGGKNKRGDDEFARRRPGWDLPIHQLMVKHGVTILLPGARSYFCAAAIGWSDLSIAGGAG